MKTLLRIDSSIRVSDSYTRLLTDHFEKVWRRENPDGRVVSRCLATDPVPHLTSEVMASFGQPVNLSSHSASLSDKLIIELKEADHILIGSPLYNLSLPSTLKAYWDHVVRSGVTFEFTGKEYRGLLEGKSATVVTARGGTLSTDHTDDYQTGYLKQVLNFIGIDSVDVISMEETAILESTEESLQQAKHEIDLLFASGNEPEWIGDFTEQDKLEISQIRESQAKAIVGSDAELYANLCTQDIQLLIPSQNEVSGKERFMAVEQDLFSRASFKRFIKNPIRIERSGDLAVEIGKQRVTMEFQGNGNGVFASRQKYTHVFRKTGSGWRFAVLMSNPSE